MNCVTHLNLRNNFASFLCFIALAINGCSKSEKQGKYVAKVNDAVLTEEQVSSALNEEQNKGKYRSEYINNWIENQILLQEAEKAGILKDGKFNSILERSKQHLAAAMYIEKILDENKIEVSDDDISKYFEANKDEFKLPDDAYRMNIIYFSDFDKAVKFRQSLLESGWERTVNAFHDEKTILGIETSKLVYRYQVQPTALSRIINNLQPGEVSIVVETEPMKFAVVQVISELYKDTVPPLDDVKEEVSRRLIVEKRKEFVRNYIDKLITDHNLEIVRYSE